MFHGLLLRLLLGWLMVGSLLILVLLGVFIYLEAIKYARKSEPAVPSLHHAFSPPLNARQPFVVETGPDARVSETTRAV